MHAADARLTDDRGFTPQGHAVTKCAWARCLEPWHWGLPGLQGDGDRGSTMPALSPGAKPNAARFVVGAAPVSGGPHKTTARSSDARTAKRQEII